MKPAVVVTGASGFIGRAVCAALVEHGAQVCAVSRTAPPEMPGLKSVRVKHYYDVKAPEQAVCVHLAGEREVTRLAQEGSTTFIESEIAVARHLTSCGFARIVFASSALVYGDQVAAPRREEEPVAPSTAYATLKYTLETVFLSAGHVVARLSNVYGLGMSPANVLSNLLKEIPGARTVQVQDLSPIRDYLHVYDVATGLVELAMHPSSGLFNLGTGVGTSVAQLARLVIEHAGEAHRPIESTRPSVRPSTVILNPTKMARRFGWRAHIALSEGVKELVERRLSANSLTESMNNNRA